MTNAVRKPADGHGQRHRSMAANWFPSASVPTATERTRSRRSPDAASTPPRTWTIPSSASAPASATSPAAASGAAAGRAKRTTSRQAKRWEQREPSRVRSPPHDGNRRATPRRTRCERTGRALRRTVRDRERLATARRERNELSSGTAPGFQPDQQGARQGDRHVVPRDDRDQESDCRDFERRQRQGGAAQARQRRRQHESRETVEERGTHAG